MKGNMIATERFEVMEKVLEILEFARKEKVTGTLKVQVDTNGEVTAIFEANDVGAEEE